jgi:transposase
VAVSRPYLRRHGRLPRHGGEDASNYRAVLRARCAPGTVVACLLIGAAGARARKQVRTFRTVRRDLEALRDWLKAAGVTHVGMESTGVYWRPVYAVLEGHVELIVGNARHIRNVPGRKTDVKDAEWIADLVRHGLIAKSFVPPAPLRELRELVRYRRKLIEAQAAERNRLLRLLETANIKLASVMSDVFGVSGRAMLKALIAGSAAPEEIAALAKGQLRRKRADQQTCDHRFLVHVEPAAPFDDCLHPRLPSSEGDRGAAGRFETLPHVLPVPGGDKE